MAPNERARQNHDALFPNHVSTLATTDPELIDVFDNFAFDEVLQGSTLDVRTRLMVQLAATIAAQALREFRVMLAAALTVGVTPIQAKEIVYQAVPYVGLAKVFDFIHATNEVLTERGVSLPLSGQSRTTPENRLEVGREDVPHGAVASVRYVATALKNARREMFVYTPPAYEKGGGTYPVLYLIHGGGDTAVSWSTVGRANDILDNLIAEKKAVPMIVIMPSGWTPSGGQVMTSDATKDPFNDEMLKDIIPYVESRYRTPVTPDTRALSGLSMGGIQTLNVGLHNLGTFRYLAVMSSGWTTEQDRNWFYTNEAVKIPNYNKELRLFWWGWGESDIARTNGLAVIDALKKQGVKIQTMETPGGHEWPNWRLYLHEVAPKLFR